MLENGLYNMDCMKGMQQFPDKYFDLAIVDPPYGGGAAENEYKGAIAGRFGGRFEKYHMAENDEERVKIAGGAAFEHQKRSRFGGRFSKYHFSKTNGRNVANKVYDKRGYL